MNSSKQFVGLCAPGEGVSSRSRERAIGEIRVQVQRYGISDTELRRLLAEVERERDAQAREARRAEEAEFQRARRRALHLARQLVEFWRIAPQELMRVKEKVLRPESARRVKYQHPVTGDAWDGEGPQPEWLRRALGSEGYRVSELLVESADAHRIVAVSGS